MCVCVREREREREGHLVFKLKTSVVESGQLWSFADKQFCQDQQGISCLTLVRHETEISGLAIRHGRCRFKKNSRFQVSRLWSLFAAAVSRVALSVKQGLVD